MRKFAIFIWLNFALIFSACSMKNTQKIDFYELNFKKSKQNLQCNMDLPKIFLTKTDALELSDSRNFIVFDENSVQRSVNSAKFIQSEFVKTPYAMAIFNALNLSTNRAISDILEQIKGIK